MKVNYKEGDTVFIANKYFDDWCEYKSGDIGVVDILTDFYNIAYINRGPERDSLVVDSRTIQKYNKANWCKVFLQFMDEQG